MPEQNQNIYIVFSSTPYKIGKLIRFATHYPYNHVSVALDKDISVLYTFARHYKNAPFYGGFVKESRRRYFNNGQYAKIKVYTVPVTQKQLDCVKNHLFALQENADEYVYNMLSAACTLIKKKVKVNHAYTCIEFVCDLLNKCAVIEGLDADRFCSIKALEQYLSGYYAEDYIASDAILNSSWGEDTFPVKKSIWLRAYLTVKTNGRLIFCFIKGLLN